MKEEHLLAYVYLPPSTKVPDSWHLLSPVIEKEIEDREGDSILWELDRAHVKPDSYCSSSPLSISTV